MRKVFRCEEHENGHYTNGGASDDGRGSCSVDGRTKYICRKAIPRDLKEIHSRS